MTIDEFKKKFSVDKIKVRRVGKYLYVDPLSVKVNFNKDIRYKDLKKNKLKVYKYLDEFVFTKDGNINQYGLKISGNWTNGYALDFHTIKSEPAEIDEKWGSPEMEYNSASNW